MCGLMVHCGLGRQQFYLELSPQLSLHISQVVKWFTISDLLVILSTAFTRVSICFFLLRIFGTKLAWRRVLYSIMALSVATGLSGATVVLAECSPFQKIWEPLIPGTCWSWAARLAYGICNGGESCLE